MFKKYAQGFNIHWQSLDFTLRILTAESLLTESLENIRSYDNARMLTPLLWRHYKQSRSRFNLGLLGCISIKVVQYLWIGLHTSIVVQ